MQRKETTGPSKTSTVSPSAPIGGADPVSEDKTTDGTGSSHMPGQPAVPGAAPTRPSK